MCLNDFSVKEDEFGSEQPLHTDLLCTHVVNSLEITAVRTYCSTFKLA